MTQQAQEIPGPPKSALKPTRSAFLSLLLLTGLATACDNGDTAAPATPPPTSATAMLKTEQGKPISFENETKETHTVTAADGAFDSGPIAPGAAWSWTSPPPGEYPVFCALHWDRGEEEGLVVVSSNLSAADASAAIERGVGNLADSPSLAVTEFQQALSSEDPTLAPAGRDRARLGIALARLSGTLSAALPLLSAPSSTVLRRSLSGNACKPRYFRSDVCVRQTSDRSSRVGSHSAQRLYQRGTRRQVSVEKTFRPLIENLVRNVSDSRRRLAQIKDPAAVVLNIPSWKTTLGSEPNETLDLSGDWKELEIRLMSFVAHALDATAQVLLAHDLSLSLDDQTLSQLGDLGLSEPAEILAVRKLGPAFEQNPTLLTFANVSRFRAGRRLLIGGVDALGGADGSALAQALKSSLAAKLTRPAGIQDVNGNGVVDAGDILMIPLLGQIVLSPAILPLLNQLPGILDRFRNSLQPQPTSAVSISDLNLLLGFLGYSAFPNMAAVRLGSWFDNPKPLRDILPVRHNAGGSTAWAIEAELSPANSIFVTADLTPEFFSVFSRGDGPHFNGLAVEGVSYELPADKIAPPKSDDDELTPYFAFRDPSFGSSLSVNLSAFDVPVAADPTPCSSPGADSFCPATNFSLNALIAYFDAVADF